MGDREKRKKGERENGWKKERVTEATEEKAAGNMMRINKIRREKLGQTRENNDVEGYFNLGRCFQIKFTVLSNMFQNAWE